MARKNENCGIYIIIVNDLKVYVGSSSNLKRRKYRHFYELATDTHKNSHLQRAYDKYGKESFRWEILEYCKKEKLIAREQFYMDKYNSTNHDCGYNQSLKADGHVISEETKEKLSQLLKGRKKSPETIERMKNGRKGDRITPEAREKGRLARLGKPLPEEARRKISISLLGNKRALGNKFSPEARQHLSDMKKGIPCTEERKRKMSEAMLKYKHLVGEWKELRKQGLNYCEIERIYNISNCVIRRYLVKYFA